MIAAVAQPSEPRPIAERRRDELPALEAAGYVPFLANNGSIWALDGLIFMPDTGEWLNERTNANGTLPETQTALFLFKRQLPQLPLPEQRIAEILRKTAVETKKCRCGATVYFLVHTDTNAKAPYSIRGVSHYLDCMHAEDFTRRPAKK